MIVQPDDFAESLITIQAADRVALDTEYTWTDVWHRRELLGISAYVEIDDNPSMFYFPFGHQHNASLFDHAENLDSSFLPKLGEILADKETIFHNAKADLTILRRVGIELYGKMWDTMIMSYMVDENSTHRLKLLAKKHVDPDAQDDEKKIKKIAKDLGGWEKVPPIAMGKYAETDVRLTYKLWQHFLPQMEEQELLPLWPIESDFIRVLTDMEWEGVGLDSIRAMRLSQQSQTRLKEIQVQLEFDPGKAGQLAHKLFARPPEGLGFLPGPLSATRSLEFPHGIPIMDALQLSRYTHEVVDLVMEHRKIVKADGTWYRGFLSVVDPVGRLHPYFKQHGTKTTRLACADPNMQQIPRNVTRHPAKTLLIPKPGFELWEFDYNQLELRLAACYSKDEALLKAFLNGEDIHELIGNQIGISRQDAKTVNYLICYGGGAGKLHETLKRPLHECRSILAEYHARYPGVKRASYEAQRAAEGRGWVRLWTGRRRHFQFEWEYHKSFNSVLQGGGAEIMKRSMVTLWHCGKAGEFEGKLVSQVHDSLWYEIPENRVDDEIRYIKEKMEWPSSRFPIPFTVDAKHLN